MTAHRRSHLALISAQGASGAGSLLLLVVTARALGAEGRGVFAFFLLWPMLGAYVVSFGLPGANLRLSAEDRSRAPALVGNTVVVTAVVAAITAVPLLLGPPRWLTGPMPASLVWTAWAALVVMVLFQGLTWLQMGLGSFIAASLLRGLFPAAAAVGFATVAALGGRGVTTATAAGLVFVASVVLVTAAVAGSIWRRTGRPRVDAKLLKTAFGFALTYQGGLVAQLVTYRADQWILGLAQPAASLGIYSVAVSTSEVATYGATAKGMTRFRDSAANRQEAPKRIVGWVAVITAATALAVAGVAVPAIPAVLGEGFRPAVELVLILLPGTLGIGLMRVCGNDLAGRGRPGPVSAVALLQAAVMVGAFLIFVPSHGAVAAAIISSAGYLAGGAATAALLIRARPGTASQVLQPDAA